MNDSDYLLFSARPKGLDCGADIEDPALSGGAKASICYAFAGFVPIPLRGCLVCSGMLSYDRFLLTREGHPMLKITVASAVVLAVTLLAGCSQSPAPINPDHLAVLRLEAVGLEADRIEFALYNTNEHPLSVFASGDDGVLADVYLGEVVVIADGRADIFMVKEIALARMQAQLSYTRSDPLVAGDCVRWSLTLSDLVRVSGEMDMEAMLLDEHISRRETYERDPEAYRIEHDMLPLSKPLFSNRERLPMPPTLLDHLKGHPDSLVAIQPRHLIVGIQYDDESGSYGVFRERSNWIGPAVIPTAD